MTLVAGPSTYRVLVVDDDPGFLQALTHYLDARGVEVSTAPDGEAAWELFQKRPPDIVLAEMLMGRLPWTELVARIRRHANNATPIFLMTGRIQSADEEAALQRQHRTEIIFRRPLALRELVTRMDALALLHTGKVRSGALVTGRTSTPPPVDTAADARSRGQAWPSAQVLSGECTMLSICAVALHAFEQRLTGMLDVVDPMGTRSLLFHEGLIVDSVSTRMGESLGAQLVRDGLINEPTAVQVSHAMERRGQRFGEAFVQVAGAHASMVVEALERMQNTVVVRALSAVMGSYSFHPVRENVVLRSHPPLDPVECVQRACLALPAEDDAAELLVSVGQFPLTLGEAFTERSTVLERVVPGSVVPGLCQDRPTLNTAVQRARAAGPTGVRELLALLLTQAVRVGTAPGALPVRRHGVLASSGGDWRGAQVGQGDLFIREMVAEEWVRTGGRPAHMLLGVPADAPAPVVEVARNGHVTRFGPPALNTSSLGPARRYLDVIRARREEAARVLTTSAPPAKA